MQALALALVVVFLALAVGLRMLVQWRRTGSTGFHGISSRRLGSPEWLAGVAFALALTIGAAAPLLALLGVVEPVAALDVVALQVIGLALALIGIAVALYAQLAMGNSWRIGVDEEERTELVTDGPFAVVRNPIFAATLPTVLGLTLMVPSWVSFTGVAFLAVALELQVRVVEEPYLLRTHGEAFASYASRVGRFFPGVGRLR